MHFYANILHFSHNALTGRTTGLQKPSSSYPHCIQAASQQAYYVRRCGLSLRTEQRGLSVCPSVTIVTAAKTAEPIEMPFGLYTRVGPKHVLNEGAHWRRLANTSEPSMCGGDAAFCQIALSTCFLLVDSAQPGLTSERRSVTQKLIIAQRITETQKQPMN